jgi:guanylate kinase
MNRREKLISSAIGPEMDETKAKMLDTTMKLVLGDMGQHYVKFWETEGPGVMVFQPENKERSMFFMSLPELESARKQCENENNDDLAETFRRILEAAQKIDPMEMAGYIINDGQGIRYLQIAYDKVAES